MLEYMRIQNVGIVEDIEITCDEHITLFTGETGTGKSMLLSSILLLLGERASVSTIRKGADQSLISSIWHTQGQRELSEWLEARGIEGEDELHVKRIVKENGRTQCMIQGQIVTLRELGACMSLLCEVHAQHEHQQLFKPRAQLQIIDRYAGITKEVADFTKKFQVYRKKAQGFRKAMEDEQVRVRELDYLQFAMQEIDNAHIKEKEDEAIMRELQTFSNIEEITRLWQEIGGSLNQEGGALSTLRNAQSALETLSSLQPDMTAFLERLSTAFLEIEDLGMELRSAQEHVQSIDPETLASLEARILLLEGLKKKYGSPLAQVMTYRQEAAEKTQELIRFSEHKEEIEAQLTQEHSALEVIANAISLARVEAIQSFSLAVNEIIHKLAMPKANFFIEHQVLETMSPYEGKDAIEFYISSNLGEKAYPLAHIVSGGELSRIMLAIKVISSQNDSLQTLILDEVDAGIGGGTARILAQYLYALGKHTQVICVTHLPIIAASASKHYEVYKEEVDGRTKVFVRALSGEARVQELARMLVGNETDTLAQSQAHQLIREYQ